MRSKRGNFRRKLPFLERNSIASASQFSRIGIKRAFWRTLKVFPETEFHSVMTRGFIAFAVSFSSPAA
jgi:hypothetical protein